MPIKLPDKEKNSKNSLNQSSQKSSKSKTNEKQIVADFAKKIGTQIVGVIPYSQTVKQCGGDGLTVFQGAADSPEAMLYRKIGRKVFDNKHLVIPNTLEFEELYDWWLPYIN